jgi:hypothetical protein
MLARRAPRSASKVLTARPIPVPPPVMKTTLFVQYVISNTPSLLSTIEQESPLIIIMWFDKQITDIQPFGDNE